MSTPQCNDLPLKQTVVEGLIHISNEIKHNLNLFQESVFYAI